jgi:hypothetical protein
LADLSASGYYLAEDNLLTMNWNAGLLPSFDADVQVLVEPPQQTQRQPPTRRIEGGASRSFSEGEI